jgi:cytosine/adenosine deaminase-related metal-dependent hydrolase
VTTVAHHNPYHAPLRARSYPVRVVSRYGWSHSLYLSPDFADTYRKTPRSAPFMIHLAEGTDRAARGELEQLDEAGALGANTVLIHGVGLTSPQRAHAIQREAALVWCPASNFFLLDATAVVAEFSASHRLALGSDSRLTGERDLLDEARVALANGQISPAALLRAVTVDAARILRLDDVGALEPGLRADLIVLPSTFTSAEAALGMLRRVDLRAVMRDGEFQIADPDFARFMRNPVAVTLDSQPKWIAQNLAAQVSHASIREPGLVLHES